eukprot:2201755-Alexandrium_andersonii.AAC.1
MAHAALKGNSVRDMCVRATHHRPLDLTTAHSARLARGLSVARAAWRSTGRCATQLPHQARGRGHAPTSPPCRSDQWR